MPDLVHKEDHQSTLRAGLMPEQRAERNCVLEMAMSDRDAQGAIPDHVGVTSEGNYPVQA